MDRTEPGLSYLAGIIPRAVNTMTRKVVPNFDTSKYSMLANGWININPQHGYNAPHAHQGFQWSGCYYVQVPEQDADSGSIQFLSPWNLAYEMEPFIGQVFRDRMTLSPKAGEMLLFPSYLRHWVQPNSSEQDRITIAFNTRFEEVPS